MKDRSAGLASTRPPEDHDPGALVVRDEQAPSAVDIVRAAIAEVEKDGQPRPGRPTLVKLTGLTGHQVGKALKELAAEDVQQAPSAVDSPDRWRAIRRALPLLAQTWPLLFIGAAAAVAVWSGWVGLGKLAGFGMIQPLPGIVDSLHIDSSVVLPVSVEAYGAYALRCWLATGGYSPRTVAFAKWSAIASLSIGAGAQIAYHLMVAAGLTRAPWWITMLVACVPVVVLGLASALAKMVTSDRRAVEADGGGDA